MGFFGGLLGGITNSLGITSARDNGKGERNLGGYKDTLADGQKVYQSGVQNLNNYSNTLAGQNVMAGANDAYGQQQQAYGQQQDAYRNQQQASQMLYNQATGQTPSVADLQMQQGLGNANNQVQSAMLSQQGGMSPGLSQRNMLNAQAMQNAQIVGQGQVARAGEVAQAQQMYNNTLGNISNQANAMGNTAAGMTNQQQQLGQFMYNQGQNNLNYQTASNTNLQDVNAGNAQNLLAAQQGNLQADAAAKAAQAKAMGNTLAAASGTGLVQSGLKAANLNSAT